MSEHEIVEVLQSCKPIFENLYMERVYKLNKEEIDYLLKFKAIWDDTSFDYQPSIEKAGMSDFEFAFLGGYLYTLELLYPEMAESHL